MLIQLYKRVNISELDIHGDTISFPPTVHSPLYAKKHTRNAQDMIYVCTYTYVHICIQSIVNTHKTHVHKIHARIKFLRCARINLRFGDGIWFIFLILFHDRFRDCSILHVTENLFHFHGVFERQSFFLFF